MVGRGEVLTRRWVLTGDTYNYSHDNTWTVGGWKVSLRLRAASLLERESFHWLYWHTSVALTQTGVLPGDGEWMLHVVWCEYLWYG